MGIVSIIITLLLAALVRKQWPGLAWLGVIVMLDLVAWAYLPASDPRSAEMLPHAFFTVMLYAVVRAVRRWNDEGDGRIWAMAAWQQGAIGTFVQLTFFTGTAYTWWNWIIIIPVNGFLAEIWPLYWIAIRPLSALLH